MFKLFFFFVTENVRATSRTYMYEMSHISETTMRKEGLKNTHVLECKGNKEQISLQYHCKI